MPTQRHRKQPTLQSFVDVVPSAILYSDSVKGRVTCEVRNVTTKPTVVFLLKKVDGTEVCESTLEKVLKWL